MDQDCSKKCPCATNFKIPSAAVISAFLSPDIFPTPAVPVCIPDAPANLANFDKTKTEKPIGFSGLVKAPCIALWKCKKTSGYFLLKV